MELEIRAIHFVHDALECMYHGPLLSPSCATLHDDFETTPADTEREREKKGKKNITLKIYVIVWNCQFTTKIEVSFEISTRQYMTNENNKKSFTLTTSIPYSI